MLHRAIVVVESSVELEDLLMFDKEVVVDNGRQRMERYWREEEECSDTVVVVWGEWMDRWKDPFRCDSDRVVVVVVVVDCVRMT